MTQLGEDTLRCQARCPSPLRGERGQPELRSFSRELRIRIGPMPSMMPRRNRCVLPGVACHITQRGVDRRETFCSDEDRQTHLRITPEMFQRFDTVSYTHLIQGAERLPEVHHHRRIALTVS